MKWLTKLMEKRVALSFLAIFALSLAVAPAALAQPDPFGLDAVRDSELDETLGDEDLRTTIAAIINVALSLLGIVAVVIVLIGGFKWMTAGGNDEKVTEAKKLLFSGIIGLVIILSAWAIARFVLSALYSASTGTDVQF